MQDHTTDPEPDDIDLASLAQQLASEFGQTPPVGYLLGKTALRESVSRLLHCSELMAEQLVDTLETNGMLYFDGAPERRIDDLGSCWQLRAPSGL